MLNNIKQNPETIVISLCEAVVGLLLLLNPVRFTSGIIIAFGTLLCILGAVYIARYFAAEPRLAAKEQRFAKGLFLLGAGLFCVLRCNWFILTFPALTILYGAALLLIGFIKIQRTVDMLRMKQEKWFIAAIGAALCLAAAGIIFVNPFESAKLLWILIALTLIAQTVCDLLPFFLKHAS